MLIWVALRYTKHNGLKDIAVHLEPYDEVNYTSTTGISTGGASKGDRLLGKISPTFASSPLNRLIDALRDAFSARYDKKEYSAEDIKEARDFVAGYGANLKPKLLPGPYVYGARMDSLKEPNWLVKVFNEHLESDDWPSDDKAKANSLVLDTHSAQKRTSQQATLEERAQGSNSKRKLG